MADIFRKSALERLSSPEQLDKSIVVSSPVSWLALLGATVVVFAVILWSVFGSLPTTLKVQGIIARSTDSTAGQTAECYAPYAEAARIEAGMRAVVRSVSDDSRFDAEVVGVAFDDTEISDMELALGGSEMPVTISLRLTGGTLPERALVSAQIITEETAPINKLFLNR